MRGRTPVAELVPWILFLLLLAVGSAWFVLGQQSAERKAAERSARAEKLGLPSDFPLDVVPLEPSIEIESVKEGDARSRDGERMIQWTLKGRSAADYKALHEFYREHFIGLGWMQTQLISIPTGQSADYANETMVVHLEIERPNSQPDTSFKMDVYQVRER